MTLENLHAEMVKALKSGDKFRKGVISVVISQIKTAAINAGIRDNITEDFVNKELQKAKKIAEDMINTCPDSRPELLKDYIAQAEIVKEFTPSLIEDENEIKNIILKSGIEINQKNQGNIMKFVKSSYGNKINMKIVNKVFKGML